MIVSIFGNLTLNIPEEGVDPDGFPAEIIAAIEEALLAVSGSGSIGDALLGASREVNLKYIANENIFDFPSEYQPLGNVVVLNPYSWNEKKYISLQDGTWSYITLEHTLIHELFHSIEGLDGIPVFKDLVTKSGNPAKPSDYPSLFADPFSDMIGQAERETAKIIFAVFGEKSRGHYLNGALDLVGIESHKKFFFPRKITQTVRL